MNESGLNRYLSKVFILLSAFLFVTTIVIIANNNAPVKHSTTSHARRYPVWFSKEPLVYSELVLSFSLFGANSWIRYGENVINVAKEARESKFYNSWTVRLYHDNFPVEIQKNLSSQYKNLIFVDVRQLEHLQLKLINKSVHTIANINGMTWRFIPMGDVTVDIMCSRDLDSPLLEREEDAVDYWMKSGKIMHVMRDRNVHGVHILGGLWCFRSSKDRIKGQQILKTMLDNAQRRSSSKEAGKGDDQNILSRYMWPQVSNDVIQHDSYLCQNYPGSEPYPSNRTKGLFAGCVRPCEGPPMECPAACRPKNHQDWIYC